MSLEMDFAPAASTSDRGNESAEVSNSGVCSPDTGIPERGSVRELLNVALPLMLSQGSLTVMHVIDRAFLKHYSLDSLAASLPSGLLYWSLLSLPIGTVSYVNTFVAQYLGAGNKNRIAAALWQGVYFSLFCAVLIGAIVQVAGYLFGVFGHSPEIQELEQAYFMALAWGSGPFLISTTLASFYSGRGKTIVILWVNLVASAVNFGFDYLLIFGYAGFPELGIRGAGIATSIANLFTAFIYIGLLARPRIRAEFNLWANWRLDRDLMGRLIRYGVPNGLNMFLDVSCFALFILLVGSADKMGLAATNLAFNLNTLAFVPMIGLGTAVMILVGQRIGENRPDLAATTSWRAFHVSLAYMGLFVFLYLVTPDLLLWPYLPAAGDASGLAEYPLLREKTVVLLRFVAAYCVFDAAQIIFGSAIRGAGDTRFASMTSLVAGVGALLIPTQLNRLYFGGNLYVSWGIVTAYVCILGVVFYYRFRGGKWRTMRVIEQAIPA